ncbi:cell division protein ZapA [Pelotomaculum terephthalicicum JT]|uniref:cell division protein ZapA n=1 Tax=Pelotomaculum TaxID=191373 RepID=UPI0009D47837|nr:MULTISPECIES: cell division protein ZapA [Pelotomaculum]MCG9968149.1 cell division protein ZapA [Pelotomaculum terephthalicicum JT]OPX83954.1 MAG: Cell division protein ZapA [Pelotomaculum sp. PtaB.Bin117]OPY63169.1 MAG: Cell division protein ZapA [Pelotomaculum sp. PtaU1.Bin065]
MSEEQKFRVEVEIFGEFYTLKGDSSPAQMMKVAQYVNHKMKQLAERNPKLSKSQAAVLAALNMADELLKLREEYENMVKMLEPESK